MAEAEKGKAKRGRAEHERIRVERGKGECGREEDMSAPEKADILSIVGRGTAEQRIVQSGQP